MAPNSAFKDGKLIFLMYYFSPFLPSIPPSCSGRELFMGCGRLLQMGERNISKFHEGNSSQMLEGVGKKQVCQNSDIQMGLQAGRRGGSGRNETTQMCWGMDLPAHEPEWGGAQEPEIGGVSPASGFPCPSPPPWPDWSLHPPTTLQILQSCHFTLGFSGLLSRQ